MLLIPRFFKELLTIPVGVTTEKTGNGTFPLGFFGPGTFINTRVGLFESSVSGLGFSQDLGCIGIPENDVNSYFL